MTAGATLIGASPPADDASSAAAAAASAAAARLSIIFCRRECGFLDLASAASGSTEAGVTTCSEVLLDSAFEGGGVEALGTAGGFADWPPSLGGASTGPDPTTAFWGGFWLVAFTATCPASAPCSFCTSELYLSRRVGPYRCHSDDPYPYLCCAKMPPATSSRKTTKKTTLRPPPR